jgi:hypothetical protein
LILTFTFQGLLYAPSGLNMNKMLYFAHWEYLFVFSFLVNSDYFLV